MKTNKTSAMTSASTSSANTSRSSRRARMIAASMLLAAGFLTTAAITTSASAVPSTSACATGSWSSTVQGRPVTLAPGSSEGVYLWHDGTGWSLRVTHPGSAKVVFTGTIDSSNGLSGVERATEASDHTYFNAAKGKVTFRFENYGRIDGIDFLVGCSNKITVHAQINGRPIPSSQVFLGHAPTNPTSVPFVAERS